MSKDDKPPCGICGAEKDANHINVLNIVILKSKGNEPNNLSVRAYCDKCYKQRVIPALNNLNDAADLGMVL